MNLCAKHACPCKHPDSLALCYRCCGRYTPQSTLWLMLLPSCWFSLHHLSLRRWDLESIFQENLYHVDDNDEDDDKDDDEDDDDES